MKNALLLILVLILASSCRDKDPIDVIAPAIGNVTVNGQDTTAVTQVSGGHVLVSLTLTDNMGLNQVQFNIHPAENGHTHTGNGDLGGQERLNSGNWNYSQTDNISGLSVIRNWDVQIPDSIAGNWHMEISLLDDVGLTAIQQYILIQVTNDNLPIITATTDPAADEAGNIFLSSTASLTVSGETDDPDKLKHFFIHLDNWAGTATDTTVIPITGEGVSMAFTNLHFDNAAPGNYRLVIEAEDSLGYKRKWDRKVLVSQ